MVNIGTLRPASLGAGSRLMAGGILSDPEMRIAVKVWRCSDGLCSVTVSIGVL